MARAVLGVAVQRQVRQHDAEAVVESLDERRQLAVAQQRRVPQHEPGPRALLAVGHARAVAVVVEAQLHPLRSPARSPPTSARRARWSSTRRALLSIRRASSQLDALAVRRPARVAPTR